MQIFIDELKQLLIDSEGKIPGEDWTLEIKSSIYDMFPTVAITGLAIGDYTPDVLGYFLGDGLDITYQLVDNTDDASKASEVRHFPKMLINDFKARAGQGGIHCDIFCTNELAFYQKIGIQGVYSNTADLIMASVQQSNEQWSKYGADYKVSDTDNKIFRTASQTETVFIKEQLYPNYLIQNDRLLFWIGLDKYLHLRSFSDIVESSKQADAWIQLGGGYIGPAKDNAEVLKKTVVKSGGVDVESTSYDIEIGDSEFYKQLAPKVPVFLNSVPYGDELKSLEFTPTGTSKKYMPISNILSVLSSGSDSCPTLTFRPDTNMQQEAKNLILKNYKPFVKVHVKGCKLSYGQAPEESDDEDADIQPSANGDEKLLLAGSTAYLMFPYFYSIYNGPYVIEEIYYNAKANGQVLADITLASNTLDETCYNHLSSDKDKDTFEEGYAPQLHLGSLLKSK